MSSVQENFDSSIQGNFKDPKSDEALLIAESIFQLLAPERTLFPDHFLGEPHKGIYTIFDEQKQEYRRVNDKYIFRIPISVIHGQTTTIIREPRKYDSEFFRGPINTLALSMPIVIMRRISDPIINIKEKLAPDQSDTYYKNIDWETDYDDGSEIARYNLTDADLLESSSRQIEILRKVQSGMEG